MEKLGIPGRHIAEEIYSLRVPMGVVRMKPVPSTATVEAQTVAELAAEHSWTSVAVVTNRAHTRRVLTNFEQYTDLDVAVIPIEDVVVWRIPMNVAREVAGYLKFWFTDPC